MITLVKNQDNRLVFQLDENIVDPFAEVQLDFYSPTQTNLTFTGPLEVTGGGYFSFLILKAETLNFIDDTYSYYLYQDGVYLDHGRLRLRELFIQINTSLDYTLNFSLS